CSGSFTTLCVSLRGFHCRCGRGSCCLTRLSSGSRTCGIRRGLLSTTSASGCGRGRRCSGFSSDIVCLNPFPFRSFESIFYSYSICAICTDFFLIRHIPPLTLLSRHLLVSHPLKNCF